MEIGVFGVIVEMGKTILVPHTMPLAEIRKYIIDQAKTSLDVEASNLLRVRVSSFHIEEERDEKANNTALLVTAQYHKGNK